MIDWRYKWNKLEPAHQGLLNSLADYTPKMMRYQEHRICVVKLQDEIAGIHNICPHAGAALHAGFCNKLGVITCPLHDYKFDLKTGKSADGNNYQIKTYKFQLREDGWYIGLKRI